MGKTAWQIYTFAAMAPLLAACGQSALQSNAQPPPAPATVAAPDAQFQAASAKEYATSEEEYDALKKVANGGTKVTYDTMPDWTGIWSRDRGVSFDQIGHGGPSPVPQTAPLKPEYAAQYAKTLADAKIGKEWDHLSDCLPAGYPRWFSEPFLREFVLSPNEAWLMNEQVSEVRRVYTDGRGHIPEEDAYPLWEGDSVGFWAGDTLVIHTNHLKADAMGYNRSGPPHSDQITTVEQWRKTGPDKFTVKIDVYDPVTLTKPWHVVNTFSRVKTEGARIDLWVCEENNRNFKGNDTTKVLLPGDPGFDQTSAEGLEKKGLVSK